MGLSPEVGLRSFPPGSLPGAPRWAAPVSLAASVAILYFVSARLSLALLTDPGDVAVFWPASGVSAGTLIALGRWARWPVVAGTIIATVAANLLGDRNFMSASVFGLANAGEALFA